MQMTKDRSPGGDSAPMDDRPDPEEQNPYDEEELRRAWREGWDAFWEGEAPPSSGFASSGDTEKVSAWLDGHAAAQTIRQNEPRGGNR